MRIAIIGAGLAGLALSYYLGRRHEVVLFDAHGVGGGASGVATGLLHPFAGARSKLNWRGREGLRATLELIEAVQPYATGPIILHRGMTRIGHQEAYYRLSLEEERVHWLSEEEMARRFPMSAKAPGIEIEEAYAIDTPRYLEALFAAAKPKLVQERVETLSALKGFDEIVVAAGAWCHTIAEMRELSLSRNRGHLLVMENVGLNSPLNGRVYAVPTANNSLIVGSSFEKDFDSEYADIARAKAEILPKAIEMVPALKESRILECRASLRCSSSNHIPICKRLKPGVSCLTALGSKGLLYHALLALEMDMSL